MLKVKQLKEQIKNLPDNMEVYIRCVYNPCGNIESAGEAKRDTYGFFGISIPCVIIEPLSDDVEEE